MSVWLAAMRPRTFPASLVPVFVGLAAASCVASVDVVIGGLTIVSALFLQVATNLANDYFDARSGVDVVVYQLLAVGSVIIHLFADAADIVRWLDLFLAAYALYLFVVLVLLPGNRGENRYGPVPNSD